MQQLYNGNTSGVLGKFPYPPYYWWESGAAWGGMINYWHFTGDGSYNNVTYNALVSQIGPAGDFVMPSEAFDEVIHFQFWNPSTTANGIAGQRRPIFLGSGRHVSRRVRILEATFSIQVLARTMYQLVQRFCSPMEHVNMWGRPAMAVLPCECRILLQKLGLQWRILSTICQTRTYDR